MRHYPIDPGNKWKFDSYLGYNKSWWNYYSQYKNIIDEMVSKIEQDTPIDTVSLPLLFLIRHSLEIALKANILSLEEVNVDVEKIKLGGRDSHKIKILFKKFKEHINAINKKITISVEVKKQIDEFFKISVPLETILHSLDEGSFSFRYPVDTNGKYIFNWDVRINISEIIDIYYSIQKYLLFTQAVLQEEGMFNNE